MLRPRDPMFRGEPESYWIKHLSYGDEEQVKEWRAYGPAGVRLLIGALRRADHPSARFYRRAYRQLARVLPGVLLRALPQPHTDSTRSTRMRITYLLCRLGNDATAATPEMARALHDEDASVRGIAITFFTDGEDQNAPLNHMDKKIKAGLLPDFLRALQDNGNWGLRNNAAVALGYYPEEKQVVVPALAKVLKDPKLSVRQSAAESLYRVAPDQVIGAGVIPVVIGIMKNPDNQIAFRAAQLLGDIGKEPSLTVPALLDQVLGKDRLVAMVATLALVRFPQQADIIIPVLREVQGNTNSAVPRWASARALKELENESSVKNGVKDKKEPARQSSR